MSMKLPPDDAYDYRMALEPQTHKMVCEKSDDPGVIEMASIAISLKRIADALEQANKNEVTRNRLWASA